MIVLVCVDADPALRRPPTLLLRVLLQLVDFLRTKRDFWPVPLTAAVGGVRRPARLLFSAPVAPQQRAPPSAAALGLLVRLLCAEFQLRFNDLPDQVFELVRPRRLAGCAGDLPLHPAGSLGMFAVTIPREATVTEYVEDPWSAVHSTRNRTKIAKDAFTACDGLAQVTLPPTVTEIESGTNGFSGAFSSCSSLTEITLPAGLTKLGQNAFSWCTSLATITLPATLAEIGEGGFQGCTSLTEVTLPPTLAEIGSDTFSGCTSLAGISLPPTLTQIRTFAFQGCTSLTEITVPAPTHLVQLVSRGWTGHGMSVDTIPGLGTFVTKVNDRSVADNSGKIRPGMRILTINGIDQTNITTRDCAALLKGLRTVELILDEFGGNIPRSDLTIPPSLNEIGSGAFQGCTSLTKIALLSPTLTQIGAAAFLNCSSLTEITLPPSLAEIGYRAFFQCTSLTEITLPASLTKIGAGAFAWCTSLTAITLPPNLAEIGWGGFEGCSSLAAITLPRGPVAMQHDAFRGCPGTPWRPND